MSVRNNRYLIMFGLLLLAVGCQAGPKAGDMAPDFTANTDEGTTFRLSQMKGQHGVVLYFYPKDETPGCVTEACAFRDKLKEFDEKGYKIVGISCDSVKSHEAFKANRKLPFTLISDPAGHVARKYGVPLESKTIGAEPSLLVQRETFVIGKDGKIESRFKVKDPATAAELALEHMHEIGGD